MEHAPSTEIVANEPSSSDPCSADARCCQHANGQPVGRFNARVQVLATRLLARLERVVGERSFSLQLLLVSVLSTLCVLSAAYLEMLFTTGARADLFAKYGAVFVSTL